MRRLVVGLGAVATLIWTGFAFVAHLLVDVIGGLGAAHAGRLPLSEDLISLISEGLRLLTGVGGPVIVTIWAIGVGIIAAVTAFGVVVAGRVARRDAAMDAHDPRFPSFGERALRRVTGRFRFPA